LSWKHSADISLLKKRSEAVKAIRSFFDVRNVLEVETPILGKTATSEPFIDAIMAGPYYLQTSPEYAMKRLIAAGIGDCYSLGKVFRNAECGSRHNPEFTMLEWYRVGFNHHQLIEEVFALLKLLLPIDRFVVHTYKALFELHCQFDVFTATEIQIKDYALAQGLASDDLNLSKTAWLDLVFSFKIMPQLGKNNCMDVIIEYPADQAALARTTHNQNQEAIAERFEVFVEGLELANGYHECQGQEAHFNRYQQDKAVRQSVNKPCPPPDDKFMAAMEHLPNCAGVAMGLDRILMLKFGLNEIKEVISFDIDSI